MAYSSIFISAFSWTSKENNNIYTLGLDTERYFQVILAHAVFS